MSVIGLLGGHQKYKSNQSIKHLYLLIVILLSFFLSYFLSAVFCFWYNFPFLPFVLHYMISFMRHEYIPSYTTGLYFFLMFFLSLSYQSSLLSLSLSLFKAHRIYPSLARMAAYESMSALVESRPFANLFGVFSVSFQIPSIALRFFFHTYVICVLRGTCIVWKFYSINYRFRWKNLKIHR